MNSIDEIGRAAGRDALDEARRTVDVDGGLDRAMTGSVVPMPVIGAPTVDRRRSAARVLLVAAAVVVAVVGGVAVLAQREAAAPADAPPPTVPTIPPPTAMPGTTLGADATTPPSATTLPSGTSPVPETTAAPTPTTTVEPATSVTVEVSPGPPIPVSYLDPPAIFDAVPFGSVALTCPDTADCDWRWEVGVREGGAVVVDHLSKVVHVVDAATSEVRVVPLEAVPYAIVVGPQDVLYGFVIGEPPEGSAVPSFRIVAIPLAGERAGTVVAEEALFIEAYTELPQAALGLGRTGVVDRVRDVGRELIGYVGPQGEPLLAPEPTIGWGAVYMRSGDVVWREVTYEAWELPVERHPDAREPYVGDAPPSPTSDGATVVWTWIGPALADGDFPPPSQQVVAWLEPDGSGTWASLADGWRVASSDVWGTVLERLVDGNVEVAWFMPTR